MLIQTLANTPSALPIDASALETSISALDNSIKTLEGSTGFWEGFSIACAIVVGIGVVGEIVVIAHEYIEERSDWRRGIVRPPDHPIVWRFWFDITATVLVIAGIFGEAGASKEIASINSQLRSKTSELRAESDKLVALVTAEAGTAAQAAVKAQGAAAQADADAGNANLKAKGSIAKANAVGAQTTILEAKESALRAQLTTEGNRASKIEKALEPRVLPLKLYTDGTTNIDDLKPVAPFEVILEYIPDFEARHAAENIAFLFAKAGWKVTPAPTGELIPDGVSIAYFSPPVQPRPLPEYPELFNGWRNSEHASEVAAAFLRLSGWQVNGSFSNRLKVGQILVSVGFKPNPYVSEAVVKAGPDEAALATNAQIQREMDIKFAPNANPDRPIRLEMLPSSGGGVEMRFP